MRILQLRFLNLNALAGEWEIDFTRPEYLAEGIFAITGPTGAGKTTLLDAICLALYGRTPRLSRINRASNEIMSRQTGACFAEVTYVTQNGHYRSHWGQHRAHRRPDGELQPARHEIVDLTQDSLLQTGVQEVAKMTEQVTGMDFNRFTRSMLLAQGGFAAFLEAPPDERAPILEQITGTNLYSQISVEVHERRAREQQSLDKMRTALSAVELLDPNAVKAAEQALMLRRRQMVLLRDQLARLQHWQAARQQLESLHQELSNLRDEAASLEQTWAQAAPQRQRLEQARRAARLEADYARLATLRDQQQDDKQRLKHVLAEQQDNEGEHRVLAVKRHEVRQRYDEARMAYRQMQPMLREALRLDQQVQQAGQACIQAGEELKRLIHSREQQQAACLKASRHRTDIRQRLKAARAYLARHASDEGLPAALASVAAQREALRADQQMLETAQQALLEFQTAQSKVDTALKQAQHQVDDHEQALRRAKEAHASEKAKLDAWLQGRLLRDVYEQKDAALRERLLLKKIHDLQAERAHLQAGHPCPLCGSLEHPFADEAMPDLDGLDARIARLDDRISQAHRIQDRLDQHQAHITMLSQKLVNAQQAVQAASHDKERCGLVLSRQQMHIMEVQKRLAQARQGMAQQLAVFGVTAVEDDTLNALLAGLEARAKKWQEETDRATRLSWDDSTACAEITRLQALVNDTENMLRDALLREQCAMAELQQLHVARQACLDGQDAEHVREQLEGHVDKAQQACSALDQAWEKQQQRQATLAARVNELQNAMSMRRRLIAKLEPSFSHQLQASGLHREEVFLSYRMPESEQQALQAQVEGLVMHRTRLAAQIEDRERRYATASKSVAMHVASDIMARATKDREMQLSTLQEDAARLAHQLRRQQEAEAQVRQQQAALTRQQQVLDRWDALHQLIGSADGKKFRNFAQGLTFEWMVEHANRQLQGMTDRYVLVHDPTQPLELSVMDHYQAGERRSTKNLSGGEGFVVSLALALGLAQMSSRRVQVDSLFLDEGFGTLDDDALDMALDTLANLQHDGKLIGVISHVPALKERISTQIRVVPVAGGRSRLEGPGCRQVALASS